MFNATYFKNENDKSRADHGAEYDKHELLHELLHEGKGEREAQISGVVDKRGKRDERAALRLAHDLGHVDERYGSECHRERHHEDHHARDGHIWHKLVPCSPRQARDEERIVEHDHDHRAHE